MYLKISFLSTLLFITVVFLNCKKKQSDPEPSAASDVKYSSLQDFYQKNGAPMQTYTIDAASGGTFTTPQGTQVNIPADCFVDEQDDLVEGQVTILFKDIYKKSDMLLSDVGTTFHDGKPLKSAGEFFIEALLNDQPLEIASGKKIEVQQPLNGVPADQDMEPMVLVDTVGNGNGNIGNGNGGGNNNNGNDNPPVWVVDLNQDLLFSTSAYIFNLYSFSGLNEEGTWCNSDNPYYFNQYTNTSLTIQENPGYSSDVFLVFKDVNSMVHVYKNYLSSDFVYNYAPLGLECTVVVIAVKDEKLHASFIPITISANQVVVPSLSEISTSDFKAKLQALNN